MLKKEIQMLKMFIALVVLMGSSAFAETRYGGDIGPATATSAVSIAAPGTGKANCITNMTLGISQFSTGVTIRVIDGLTSGTTIFAVTLSSSSGLSSPNPVVLPFSADDPLCGSLNKGLRIYNSAGTYEINYKGYIRTGRQ
jgi:hypothetical protein